MRKRAGKEHIANTTETSVNTGQTFPVSLKLSVNPTLQVGAAVFFYVLWYVESRAAQSVCRVCVRMCACLCVGGDSLPFTYAVYEYSTIEVKSTNLCHPLCHFIQKAEAHLNMLGGRKSAKCQKESSKVCWRAGGEDKKNADECKRTIYLTWVAMQEKMTSLPSINANTVLKKQHNVTHSSE